MDGMILFSRPIRIGNDEHLVYHTVRTEKHVVLYCFNTSDTAAEEVTRLPCRLNGSPFKKAAKLMAVVA